MFKATNSMNKDNLAGGSCKLPCLLSGYDLITTKNHENRCCIALKNKFKLNIFHTTGNYQDESDNTLSTIAHTYQDTMIFTIYKWDQMNEHLKLFDLLNTVMIPTVQFYRLEFERKSTCNNILFLISQKTFGEILYQYYQYYSGNISYSSYLSWMSEESDNITKEHISELERVSYAMLDRKS